MKPAPPRFTQDDAERAHIAWGCNCGPGALAAILGLTLAEVRPHMGDFELKGYTNPTLMMAALDHAGARWAKLAVRPGSQVDWPHYGLVRIQWEGPWMAAGVPIAARYRHTHWVGACRVPVPPGSVFDGLGIFDINCMVERGWVSFADWTRVVVPALLEDYPRASGGWHVTHCLEVARPA